MQCRNKRSKTTRWQTYFFKFTEGQVSEVKLSLVLHSTLLEFLQLTRSPQNITVCGFAHKFKMASRANAIKSCASKLTKSEKKASRKQARKLHSLSKHDAQLAQVSDCPTPHLMVGNGGLMCGTQRHHILNLFQKFGHVEQVVMLPRRSYSFVTYRSLDEAKSAMDRVHGRPLESPSEFPRPGVVFYLSYMTSAPGRDDVKGPDCQHPSGLILVEDFVNEDEEKRLIDVLGWREPSDHDCSNNTGMGDWIFRLKIEFSVYSPLE